MSQTKYIIVTGGVISGVGKGIATASIAKILKERGFSVTAVKIDPYINYDAGTLRPTEHGEVWVTDDGGEIDQDLGNYERFLNQTIPKKNNITTGQVYKAVIDRERNGEYLGETVQFIPHIPDEIKRRIYDAAKSYDFAVVEIGGTAGDYENIPFLFAAKSMEVELGRINVAHVLVSYMPVPPNIGEMKSKPTQQAIRMLNENGIYVDFVLCRSTEPVDDVRKKKIGLYANIPAENIIAAPDVKSIYEVPLNFEREKLGEKLMKRLGVTPKAKGDWTEWRKLVDGITSPKRLVDVAIVGKYVDIGNYSLADSYVSINQSLDHAGANAGAGIRIHWIDSKKMENNNNLNALNDYDGIIIPGGFGSSGVEGKINAIEFARKNNIPYLGLCYGMQLAVVEYARNVCNMDANTTEVAPSCSDPVIDILPEQKAILATSRYGATMRLGSYGATLRQSKIFDLYKKTGRLAADAVAARNLEKSRMGKTKGENIVLERHRHRFEVNPDYVERLEKAGMAFPGFHVTESGVKLMEFMELPNHPFFVGTQAHPEFKSRLENPAPLFLGFVEACLKRGK
ncbi:MAG: CTP synthase [Candidatus Aenigmarchaeota archaeon]|nr:CTP synthase [Candidatus Aenigmarchaeota archaeon]